MILLQQEPQRNRTGRLMITSTLTNAPPNPVVRLWHMFPAVRGLALLSPSLLLMLTALISPFVLLAAQSFVVAAPDGGWAIGFSNYGAFVEKPQYAQVLVRSLWMSSIVSISTVLMAYPAAYFIAFHVHSKKTLWLILITLPFWTSYLLRVFAWKLILGFNGAVNSALVWLGIVDQPLEFLLYNKFAVVLTLAHAWAAFAILPIYVSLHKIDRSYIEAARDLGASAAMSFLRVTLPLSLPGVVAALLLVLIPTAGDYVTPKLVGGPNSIMVGNLIQLAFGRLDNWPLGAAISIVSMLAVTATVCLFLLLLDQFKRRLA